MDQQQQGGHEPGQGQNGQGQSKPGGQPQQQPQQHQTGISEDQAAVSAQSLPPPPPPPPAKKLFAVFEPNKRVSRREKPVRGQLRSMRVCHRSHYLRCSSGLPLPPGGRNQQRCPCARSSSGVQCCWWQWRRQQYWR